ncbi:iminophenyl-pyruvate dimer synthase VioB [Microbulbifer sp. SSSA002]|uniref:iminophenyl-pyruvate dimer synthase VioB n=1 Tax=Microbulbifer sp. SSSA002 TaxID=3243376 RepID=UPI004039043F
MSVLDFPRIHFKGIARVNVPTANRNVNNTLDIASNTAFKDGSPFDLDLPPSVYHEYLRGLEPRFNTEGERDQNGIFNLAAGYNMRGNNHFSWENTFITAVQDGPGRYITDDSLIGKKVDLWGHYNEYLRTTFNRARWVDNDPTRRDSAMIYAGQLTISDPVETANTEHILSADINCPHGVRWMNRGYIDTPPQHFLNSEMSEARLFQFSVKKDSSEFVFNQFGLDSEFLELLKQKLQLPNVLGLSIQYCVSNLSPPARPNIPVFCDLHGTIGLWYREDMATCPTGRVFYPDDKHRFSPIAISFRPGWVSLNTAISFPHERYLEGLPVAGGMPPKLSDKVDLGDLYLKSLSGRVIAIVKSSIYQANTKNSGLIDVPLLESESKYLSEPLRLCTQDHDWYENDWYVQAEQHIAAIESPHRYAGDSSSKLIDIRSYYRGEPKQIDSLATHIQTPDKLICKAYIQTDVTGWGALKVESLAPGSGKVFLGERYGSVQVRVLGDDWALLDVPTEEVDYEFLYKNVMAYYELFYPFMGEAVFSMADKCKCETYARLMWQMCDPKNRDKSYYMPSTREMSEAQSHLFLKYLCNVERLALPNSSEPVKAEKEPENKIKNKEQLIAALRDAVDLELSIMQQYLYSAYSLPNYAVGDEYVKLGRWTNEQLHLTNGSKDRRHNSGWRGCLLEVAHEEMIHYLVVNNLLMSLGEKFYPGKVLVGEEAKAKFGLEVDFSFEPFSEHVVAKFVRFEWPAYLPAVGKTIAGFYAEIRQAIEELPDLFPRDKVNLGGEHHLFLNEIINRAYPAYQFEVYDRETALFAINFVTEQGEGVSTESPHFEVSHFNRLRSILKDMVNSEMPFEPSYTSLKNPVLDPREGCNLVCDIEARSIMQFYEGCYALMFQMIAQHFSITPLGSLRRSRLMNAAIDIMTGVLRPLSVQLMSLPSGIPGRTAGPPIPKPAVTEASIDIAEGCIAISEECKKLHEMARDITTGISLQTQIELLQFFQEQMQHIAEGKVSREG